MSNIMFWTFFGYEVSVLVHSMAYSAMIPEVRTRFIRSVRFQFSVTV